MDEYTVIKKIIKGPCSACNGLGHSPVTSSTGHPVICENCAGTGLEYGYYEEKHNQMEDIFTQRSNY